MTRILSDDPIISWKFQKIAFYMHNAFENGKTSLNMSLNSTNSYYVVLYKSYFLVTGFLQSRP